MQVIYNGQSVSVDNSKPILPQLNVPNAKKVMGMKVNGEMRDLFYPVQENDEIDFLTFEDADGQYMFWHTSAHVLAQAVLRHFPEAQPTIGPPIEEGFYYDFAKLKLTEEDLKKIEIEANKITNENFAPERIEYPSKEEALKAFAGNPFKEELIEEFGENLSAYTQGEFTDLCRGPHIPNLGKIKSFKILKTSGAYWRAKSENEQLTRIYAISYPDKKQMEEYLNRIEEAKRRDHRVIGKKMDLFSFQQYAPGMTFFHPGGMSVWHELIRFWYEKHREADYTEIKTPVMLSQELWELSGHWENYKENIYLSEIDDRKFALKPMNCPGCMLYFKSGQHSYRDLPMRIAEIGNVHRHELSGALSGLFRVRSFHQDDSHLFMRRRDLKSEILEIIRLAEKIYSQFGLEYKLELSTRPEKSIGTDEQWEFSTDSLRQALDEHGYPYKVNEGDGAFYGPKIDFHIQDAIGRTWQTGTIQLDMNFPDRFDLYYDEEDGTKQRPVILHRTIYGSIERFMGILIEHFVGKFPLWLSPVQLCILPVADRHAEFAESLSSKFAGLGFRSTVDKSSESINKRVRNAQQASTPYVLVVGDNEMAGEPLSVRLLSGKMVRGISFDDFTKAIREEYDSRSLTSPYQD